MGLRQTPSVAPTAITQLPLPAPGKAALSEPPQQSSSPRHSSPVMRQPEAGAQILKPLGS
jgi:hypothetical protein